MSEEKKLSIHDCLIIAGNARVSHNTVKSFVSGTRRTAPAIAKAIAETMVKLGYELPPHARVSR